MNKLWNVSRKTDLETAFDDVFVHEENEAQTVDGSGFPYAQDMSSDGGVFKHLLDDDERVNDEMNKALGCGKTALGLEGVQTLKRYYKFIYCYRWFCRECGSKGGRIHKKRMSGILRKIEGALESQEKEIVDKFDLRQFVFTLPVQWRERFLSRKAINSFYRMVERIIKEEFPSKPSIIYFHPFGDRQRGFYHPHMNVHILEEKGQRLQIEPVQLERIKAKFYRALVSYGCRKEELGLNDVRSGINYMNVHYSFQTRPGMKYHRLKYMSRPNPGYLNYDAVKKDPVLKALFLGSVKDKGMSGFMYVRYFNGFRGGLKDIDRKEEIREAENSAGERLRVARDRDGHIMYKKKSEINLLYREKELEELSEGFFRVVEIKRKKGRLKRGKDSRQVSGIYQTS